MQRSTALGFLLFACGTRTMLTEETEAVDAGVDVRDVGIDIRDVGIEREAEGIFDAPCTSHTGVVLVGYEGTYSFFDTSTIAATKVFDLSTSCLRYERAYSMTDNPLAVGAFYIATDTNKLFTLGINGQCITAKVTPPSVPTLVFDYGLGTIKTDVYASVFSHTDGSHGLWKLQGNAFKQFAPFDTTLGPCKLTGAGSELWALCETWFETSIAKIDPATGNTLENHALGTIAGMERKQAMADATGGLFWVFSANTSLGPTIVYSFDPKTNKLTPKGTVAGAVTSAVAGTACF